MMSKKSGVIFVSLGFLFLLNAIFGRYIVLPGYLASLEQGQSTIASAGQAISVWKIIRYLLWAYSFKLGIYFIILGATLYTRMPLARRWSIVIGGFVYIVFAYIPLPSPASIIFGLAGGLMTLLMILHFFAGQMNVINFKKIREQQVTIVWQDIFSLRWLLTPYVLSWASKLLL